MSNIILPVAELKPALVGLGKVISKRTKLPVLGMVKIERTRDGWITLTSTDLDAFVTVRLEEPVAGPAVQMLVSHEDLCRITKSCSPGEALTIEQISKEKVRVHYPIGGQTAQTDVESLPVEEYPAIPKIKAQPVSISNDIRQALHEAMECSSEDVTRVVLNGAYLDVSDRKAHHIVGTNGRHLYASSPFNLPLSDSFIIPNHKFLRWKEFGRDGEWQLRIGGKKKDEAVMFQLSTRRWRFISKAIDGNYPNWKQVIPPPSVFKTTVELENVDAFIQLVKRLPVAANDTNKVVGLKIEKRRITVRGRNAEDDKWMEIEAGAVTVTGSPVTIHLNREYVVKALSFGLSRIEIQDELSALRFTDGSGKQIVVMPVRVNGPAPSPRASNDANGSQSQHAAPESNGKDEVSSVHSEAHSTSTKRSNMPRIATNGNGTNGNGHRHTNGDDEKSAVETALEKIEVIKGSYREAIHGLNDLSEMLRQVQREQKTNEREVRSVRTTLEKLQTVRI